MSEARRPGDGLDFFATEGPAGESRALVLEHVKRVEPFSYRASELSAEWRPLGEDPVAADEARPD